MALPTHRSTGSRHFSEARDTASYQVTRRQEHNGDFSDFQCIMAMPEHARYSLEELRMNDYSHKRGQITHPSGDFPTFTLGLALANVRRRLNTFNTPLFARTLSRRSLRLGAKMVLFRVGKEKPKEFAIHENVIAPVSEFVQLALSNEWKEAQERTIPLPDDEPEVFNLLQNWLYTRSIPCSSTQNPDQETEYRVLVQAYILGDKFGITDFKDAVIDSIIFTLRTTGRFDPRLANLVYENTMEHSPLRRLWQDIYVWAGSPGWLNEEQLGEYINAEFTLDLSRYQMRMIRNEGTMSPPYEDAGMGGCAYHEHLMETCHRVKLER